MKNLFIFILTLTVLPSFLFAGTNSEEVVLPFAEEGYKFELKLKKEKTELYVLEKPEEMPSQVQLQVKRENKPPLSLDLHLVSKPKDPFTYEGEIVPFGGSQIAGVFELHFNVGGKKKLFQSKSKGETKSEK